MPAAFARDVRDLSAPLPAEDKPLSPRWSLGRPGPGRESAGGSLCREAEAGRSAMAPRPRTLSVALADLIQLPAAAIRAPVRRPAGARDTFRLLLYQGFVAPGSSEPS